MTLSRSLVLSIVLALASIVAPTTSSTAQEIFFRASPHAIGDPGVSPGGDGDTEPTTPPEPRCLEGRSDALRFEPGSFVASRSFADIVYGGEDYDTVEFYIPETCERIVSSGLNIAAYRRSFGPQMFRDSLNYHVSDFLRTEFDLTHQDAHPTMTVTRSIIITGWTMNGFGFVRQ